MGGLLWCVGELILRVRERERERERERKTDGSDDTASFDIIVVIEKFYTIFPSQP